jgi:hypothetical protein
VRPKRNKNGKKSAVARKRAAQARRDRDAMTGTFTTQPATLRACERCAGPQSLEPHYGRLWCAACKRFAS